MKYREREWLYQKYVEEQLSSTQIGEICGVTKTTICDWLNRHGIETRDPSETTKLAGILAGENNPMHGREGRISGDDNPMRDPDVAKKNAEQRRGKTYPAVSAGITGESNPNWGGGDQTFTCMNCGETFTVPQSYIKGERKFCDRACRGEYYSGENHPLWKEGYIQRRDHVWRTETRPAVLERDGYECQGCGMTNSEHLDRISQGLHIHHIEYGTDDLADLITMCEWCHAKITNGVLTLDECLSA